MFSASLRQQQTYALPTMATSFIIGSLAIMQGMYAKHFGLSLTTLATVVFIANLFDVITDPLIGYYSDRYHARSGTRKPFVMLGGLLFIISSYFLYAPVDIGALETINERQSAPLKISPVYFLTWYLAFYFSWTLFEIPHLAWGGELATTSQAKTKIYGMRAFAAWVGILLFYLVPFLPIFESKEFTPQTLYWAVLGIGFFMLPLLYICMKVTPNSIGTQHAIPDTQKKSVDLIPLFKEMATNKPLRLFLTSMVLFNISVSGMWLTLFFIFADTYLQLGERFAEVSLIGLCVGIPMMGVWCWLANYWEKSFALSLGLLLSTVGIFGTGLLTPGETSYLPITLVSILCFGMGGPAFNCLAPAILADIVDYGTLKYSQSRSATYFSLYSLVSKIATAMGSALGLSIAGFYGFDPTAMTQSSMSIFGMQFAIAWLPAAIMLMAILFVSQHPITNYRHNIICRRLKFRNASTKRPGYTR